MSDNLVSDIKKIMVSFSLYTTALILGPLVFFGAIGFLLDYYFQSGPVILIVCVILAFIFSNIFIYRKVGDLNKIIKSKAKGIKKENNNNET